MGEVVPSRAFLIFFSGSFKASTAYREKRGFSFSASKNVFRWWVCSFGSICTECQIIPFCSQNYFSMGRLTISFCVGGNRKHPLWLMRAPYSCILNRKCGYGKTKYVIRFHLLLMYHVIPSMRNANFVNKYGYFGNPSISMERFNVETSYLAGVFIIPSICQQVTNYPL